MASHDRLIAEANHRRSDDTRLGLLIALTFLARCFSLGEHGDCVAAVFGRPRQQEAAEDVLADEKTQNDGNLEGDEGAESHLPDATLQLLELSTKHPFFVSDGDENSDVEPGNPRSLHGSPTLSADAKLEDSLETQNSLPSATPCKTPLALIVTNNEAHHVPSHFKSTSLRVKQALLQCILHPPNIAEQRLSLIILGRECCSSWLDERFFRLLNSLSIGEDGDTTIPSTGHPSRDIENYLDEWNRKGGAELDGMAKKQKDALDQLLVHFSSIDHSSLIGNTVFCSLFRAIITLILQHKNGKEVNLARDKTNVSDRSFVALVLAMSVLGDSAFMLNIGRVPMPVSLSDSVPESVRLRCFRRRWLRIVSLARGAQNVIEVAVPMITASFDCSDGPVWSRPGFENEFLTSDKYIQILWADRVPAPPKISETAMSPTDFITSIFEQAQPSRRKDEVKRLLEEWKDTLVLSAWKAKQVYATVVC